MKLNDPKLIARMSISAATDPIRRQTVMALDCLDTIVLDPYTQHGRIIAAMCGGMGTMAASRGDLMLLIPITVTKPKTQESDESSDSHEASHRLGEERQLREKTLPQSELKEPEQTEPQVPVPRRASRAQPLSRIEVITGILQRAQHRITMQRQQADAGEAATLAVTQDRRTRNTALSYSNGKES